MARLVLILLIPLVCLAAIIYKLAKARRVVSADDMLISAYAPSLAVRTSTCLTPAGPGFFPG